MKMDNTDDEEHNEEHNEEQADEPILLLHERKERAFTLYCQGMRAAAIGAAIGVSESSVRRWLRASLSALVSAEREEAAQADRLGKLMRAIESQRAIASAAWDAYTHERVVEEAILRGELDRVRRRAIRTAQASEGYAHPAYPHIGAGRRSEAIANGEDGEAEACVAPGQIVLEEYERPRHVSQGARYLAVALAAQREVAHLQGLYERIERDRQDLPDVHITLTRQPQEGTAPHEHE